MGYEGIAVGALEMVTKGLEKRLKPLEIGRKNNDQPDNSMVKIG